MSYLNCLDRALACGGDFAELYLEDKDESCLHYGGGASQSATSTRIHGAGLYVLRGHQAVYAYSSDTSERALMALAERAGELVKLSGGSGRAAHAKPLVIGHADTPNPIAASLATRNDRIAMLKSASAAARSTGLSLPTLNADLFETDQRVTILNSDGLEISDRRCSARVRLQMALSLDGALHYEWTDRTVPNTFDLFRKAIDCDAFAHDTALDMADAMRAGSAKGGRMPVVMEAGCGTLWHEACGHMLESVAILDQTSPFVGRIGEKIASDKVTLLDDGSIPGLYGSTAIDDEGHPTQKNVLIQNGVLVGYLADRLGARRLGMARTGSGRRQSYTFAPVARMNNTYLDTGFDDEDEMIASVDRGLYVRRLGGGNSGRSFSIAVAEGYLIEKGQITRRVKGLTLTGSGEEIMRAVDRVGRVNQYEESGGFCGAGSGLVPVTSFQPRMRISEMNVAGED